ncbi:MAG: hypothetical protein ACOCVM_00335 [Desulfovibrionaceae bacterium]
MAVEIQFSGLRLGQSDLGKTSEAPHGDIRFLFFGVVQQLPGGFNLVAPQRLFGLQQGAVRASLFLHLLHPLLKLSICIDKSLETFRPIFPRNVVLLFNLFEKGLDQAFGIPGILDFLDGVVR